jgi:hypothetical protein
VWLASAGGHDGVSKAASLRVRVLTAPAMIVRMRWPLMPSHLRVGTEAVFVFSSC